MAMKAMERFTDARGAVEGKVIATALTALLAFSAFTPSALALADEADDFDESALAVNDVPMTDEADAKTPLPDTSGVPGSDEAADDASDDADEPADGLPTAPSADPDADDADDAAGEFDGADEPLAPAPSILKGEANDGAIVRATAAEGATFPEGAQVRAETAFTDKVTGALEASLAAGQRLGTVRAYKIDIVDAEGNPLNAAVPCMVSLENTGVPAFGVTVFRLVGDNTAQKVDEPVGMVPDGTADLETLSFKAEVASAVYALATVESVEGDEGDETETPLPEEEAPAPAPGPGADDPAEPAEPTVPAGPDADDPAVSDPEETPEAQTIVMYVGEKRTVSCKNVQHSHGWVSDNEACVAVENINAAQVTLVAKAPGRTTVQCDMDAVYEVTVKPLPATEEITHFYFLPPTENGAAADLSQAKYMGSGLVTVPAGYDSQSALTNGTVLAAGTSSQQIVNLRNLIREYPSDAEVRQGLAAYFKGTIDAGENGGSSLKYEDSWNYRFEPVLFKGKLHSVGCDGTALVPNQAYHMYVQLTIDVPEQQYTAAYEVRTPSGIEHRTVLHSADDGAIELNGYSASATNITVDGIVYPAVKTDGDTVTYHFDGWYTDRTCTTRAPQTYAEKASATFYARYLAVDAKAVTFDPAGGVFADGTAEPKVHRANQGEVYLLMDAPQRYGYVFEGWQVGSGASLHKPGYERIMGTDDVTYTAVWKADEATITFDAGDGTLEGDPNLMGTTGAPVENTTLPTPVLPGYKLVGWYDNAHFSGQAIKQLPSTFPAGNTVYYAKYEVDPAQRYTVTYCAERNAGGYVTRDLVKGFGAIITDQGIIGNSLDAVRGANAVALLGWQNAGWYKINAQGNEEPVPTDNPINLSAAEAQANLNTKPNGTYADTVYVAHFAQDGSIDWENKRAYTVEYFFMNDEGQYAAEPSRSVSYTGVVNCPVRFEDAMLNSDLTVAERNDYVLDEGAEGAVLDGFLLSAEDSQDTPVLKVYLQKRLAVDFDRGAHGDLVTENLGPAAELVQDDGVVRVVRYRCLKGAATPAAPAVAPTEGYAFTGWAEGDQITDDPAGVAVTRATTYTAQYEALPAALHFDAQGGSPVKSITGVTDQSLAGATVPTTTREGYIFLGWFDDEGASLEALPEQMPAGEKTYHAQWEAADAYITFNGNASDVEGTVVGTQGKTDAPVEADFPAVANLTRPGYRFAGWNTQADGKGLAVTEYPATFPAGTTTYYAQWKLDVTGLTGESFSYQGTYDGRAHSISLPAGFFLKEGERLAMKVQGAWTDNAALFPTYKDVADSASGIEVAIFDRDGQMIFSTDEVSVAIAPAKLVVATGSVIHPFDGTVATSDQIVLTGLQAGETLGARTTGAASQVGEEVVNGYELTWAGEGNDYTAKQGNYLVEEKLGTVKVVTTDCPVTIEGYVGVYDGQEHAIAYESPEATIAFDADTAYTDAGDHAVNYTVTCADHGTFTGTVNVNILPRPITIAVEDSYKVATAADPVFRGAIVEGELVETGDLGDITFDRDFEGNDVGVYEGGLTAVYTPNDNYDVSVLRGTFTIGPAEANGAVNQYPLAGPGSQGPAAPPTSGRTLLAETDGRGPVTTVSSLVQAQRMLEAAQSAGVYELPVPVYGEVIGDNGTPLVMRVRGEAIEDEATALGAFDEPRCWVHWAMAFGMLLTVGYALAVVVRRLGYARKAASLDDNLTGGSVAEEAPAPATAERMRA